MASTSRPSKKKSMQTKSPSCDCRDASAQEQPRKAHGVDPKIKAANLTRLKRIEGQVRGLARMIEEDRYCPQILTQIAAVHEALRAVGRELMRNHLRHCISHAARTDSEEAQAIYDEFVELIHKSAR